MRFIKKLFLVSFTALILVLPNAAIAQTNKAASTTSAQTNTCAELQKKIDNAGGTATFANVPKYCSIGSLYTKIINAALFAIGIVTVIAIIYGGYLYMTAAGNDAQTKKAKSVLTWAIVGLVVVIFAATIVNVVVSFLVDNRFV